MSEPYIGEIRMFGGTFAPVGWSFCEGQILPISEYDTLFTLLGTTFGGDGQRRSGCPISGAAYLSTWGRTGPRRSASATARSR